MSESLNKAISNSQLALLSTLSDGEFHSGESLGQKMAVSRAAIWKQLQALMGLGLEVESQRGLGYRICGGLDLLDRESITAELADQTREGVSSFDILPVTVSTNQYLLNGLASGGKASGALCMAEYQTGGRGRRGRAWHSSFAGSLCMSFAWRFDQGVAALEGLSLAVGVVVCQAIESIGVQGVSLKWPNDVLYGGRKLAGILLEMSGDASGLCDVVIGVGLNVRMPEGVAQEIDQPWVDLRSIVGGSQAFSRNQVAVAITNRLVPLLRGYQVDGFSPYKMEWESRNAHQAMLVEVSTPARVERGVVQGVTSSGGLMLKVDGETKVFLGGEVSLRGKGNVPLS